MHRTNIYLSEEQERKLDARARNAGISRSALVRSILDAALGEPNEVDSDTEAAFARLSDAYRTVDGDLFQDDPDLRIDR